MKTPIDFLKYQLERYEQYKKDKEIEIDRLEKEKEDTLEEFKNYGLTIIDIKAAIKKLEEK